MRSPSLFGQELRIVAARSVKSGRVAVGWSRRELARRSRLSRQLVDRVEAGAITPSFDSLGRLFGALGIEAELLVRAPFLIDGARQRDAAHALCGAYAQRRLEKAGCLVRREVEIVHGRSHGWIDLLAFDPRTASVLVVEIKTQVDDLGRIERSLGWYEREAWPASRRLGWRPRRVVTWLLVLATSAADERIGENRRALASGFPRRPPEMAAWLRDAGGDPPPGRGLAMIDPSSRRHQWLIRPRIDGRRLAAPYRDYADFMAHRHS